MPSSRRGGPRLPATQVLAALQAADRFPPGDPRREAGQRRAARLIAADPATLDHPALSANAPMLRRWSRFVPYLLSDGDEAAMAATNRRVVADALGRLRELEHTAATSLLAADTALRALDSPDTATRHAADAATALITDVRAPVVADVLADLAACHLADDATRGMQDWRTRFAFVQGTEPQRLATLRRRVAASRGLALEWYATRRPLVGGAYGDRRVGLPAVPTTLEQQAAAAGNGLAGAVPSLAEGARAAARRIRPGAENVVTVEADGRLSATVAHRPTPRGALMVAHETGHALHALAANSPEAPGALVGETVACWSALVTGRMLAAADDEHARAAALALGDTLVEELFVSAAVSDFEDEVYRLSGRGAVTVDELDHAWLAAHRELFGVDVPAVVGSGWARLPALATDPGHAVSYVWATVLALAMDARHRSDAQAAIATAIEAGGIDADEFTVLLGFDGDEWIDEGLGALSALLGRLAEMVAA